MYTTLIDSQTVAAHLHDPDWVIVDCRFSLADTELGRRNYLVGHIPGAIYAHLDHDLSGPPVTDAGRHPLPTPEALVQLFSRLGIGNQTQVVAYDDANGMVASRLWWMLRYMGHEAVAVLEGGFPAWKAAGLPEQAGSEGAKTAVFTGTPRHDWVVVKTDVLSVPLLVDSRAPDRYRGEIEPIDAVAGHVPGAVNFFYQRNWGEGGYLAPAQLAAQFRDLLGNTPADEAVFYCGSGVSACANLLALVHAGVGNGRLYVGSWSEWSSDPNTPKATGAQP